MGWFVFGALTAIEILAIFAYDSATGNLLEAPVVGLFLVMHVVQAALVVVGLLPSPKRNVIQSPSPA